MIDTQYALHRIARQYIGQMEVPGHLSNPVILAMLKLDNAWVQGDETPWCSAFVNWVCFQWAVERTYKLNARSWINVGTSVSEPVQGDVAVFWRESQSSWKGHVAFVHRLGDSWVEVVGGNQGDSVSMERYPLSRLLGYRRLQSL